MRSKARKASKPGEFQKIVIHAFGLRPAFSKVFLLCDIGGLTVAEAASILGISHAAVTLRLERARRELQARLRD